MLFYRSKPLIFDAGHGETRKLTDLSPYGRPPLATLLYCRSGLPFPLPLQFSRSCLLWELGFQNDVHLL